jgi:Skp family chaperone for outer membrane proteins
MRNAVGIFVMLFAFVAVQAQTKVAHINSSQLIEAMPEADSIQKKINERARAVATNTCGQTK